MNTTKKRGIYLGAAVVIALLILWGLFRETPVSVETAVSKRGPMIVTVDGEGKTRFRVKRTITAPISGKISRIKLAEGDNIPHDYPITEIDPNPPLQRAPDKYDERPNLYAAKVFSPVSGKVLRVFQKSEGYVSAGTPLVEIGDPAKIEIVVDILSTDAVRIPPGAVMLIETPAATEPVQARVTVIEPQAVTKVSALGVEEQRVNVIGGFLSNAPKFGDNFRVDIRIVVWEAGAVLTIPSSALFRNGEDWNVFVVESGRARQRKIRAGQQNAADTEILEGLNEGETVILHPPNQLTDASKVSVR